MNDYTFFCILKDRLLAELLIKHKEIITAYHEHDSLLVNQEQEELTEDERSAAWVEYEAEKQGLLQDFGNVSKLNLMYLKPSLALSIFIFDVVCFQVTQ